MDIEISFKKLRPSGLSFFLCEKLYRKYKIKIFEKELQFLYNIKYKYFMLYGNNGI